MHEFCKLCETLYTPDGTIAIIHAAPGDPKYEIDDWIEIDGNGDYWLCHRNPDNDNYYSGGVIRIEWCPCCGRKLRPRMI